MSHLRGTRDTSAYILIQSDTTQSRTHHLVLPPIPFLKRENEREREREKEEEKERERVRAVARTQHQILLPM